MGQRQTDPSLRDQQESSVFGRVSSHFVHAADHREVRGAVVFRSDQEAIALSSGEIDHVRLSRLSVYSVNFDDLHGMPLDPEVLASESTNVGQAEEVGLARLHRHGEVRRIVHERRLGNRFGACGVFVVDEPSQ